MTPAGHIHAGTSKVGLKCGWVDTAPQDGGSTRSEPLAAESHYNEFCLLPEHSRDSATFPWSPRMRHALGQSSLSVRGMEVWASWTLPMTEGFPYGAECCASPQRAPALTLTGCLHWLLALSSLAEPAQYHLPGGG